MALNTTGNWEAGDDLRVIECLGVPFGSYTLTCIQNCANQLEIMSDQAVLNVKEALTEYEAAKTAQTTQDLSNSEGKTLVKADVLEWERNGTGATGPQVEMIRARDEVAQYFAFCSCLGGLQASQHAGTSLIRS